MDNLTHSMTAALAAKFTDQGSIEEKESRSRTIFWLMIASVNFPDLDVVMALFRDPVLTIKTHRWITHSIIAAPLFAVIPAAVFYRFGRVKNFLLLWLVSLVAIYLHIVSDLVTPYGTMLLAPFSNHRFTLGSQFIVDVYFSFGLLFFIVLGKFDTLRRRIWHWTGLVFMIVYLAGTFGLHQVAQARVEKAAANGHFDVRKVSALPLPLSIFNWVGLVQTTSGVRRTYFSLFDRDLQFEDLRHAEDTFATQAIAQPLGKWYLGFAHHPLIVSRADSDGRVVEIQDLQFSAPERLVKMLGMKKPRSPFTLRFFFNGNGEITRTGFNQ